MIEPTFSLATLTSVALGVGSKFAAFQSVKDISLSGSLKSRCELARSWISECLKTHVTCSPKPESTLPTRLLDISATLGPFIVLIETDDSAVLPVEPLYATLSHCWGKKEFQKTLLSNVDAFKRGFAISSLPQTFQDAITVARGLGINYLWIDSLCIIQDSKEDWKTQSALMASVYSNSYLNIAATASADSSQSFLSSQNRDHASIHVLPDERFPAIGDKIFARHSLREVHKLFSTPSQNVNSINTEVQLLSRAWVFQERHLAPRTLHFHPSEIVLECREGLRCECTGLDNFSTNPQRDFNNMSFNAWYGVVEEFSRLSLTYQSDKLEALNGVARVFWEKLNCRYLKGLWEDDMAKGLLWNVTRFPPAKPSTRQSSEVAPTWSWASLVPAEGGRIYFPARQDRLFCADQRFRFVGTDPAKDAPQATFRNECKGILINCGAVDASAHIWEAEDGSYGITLLFQEDIEDIEDMVLISSTPLVADVEPEVDRTSSAATWEVACLLIGSAEEKTKDTDQMETCHRMLVVQPSERKLGSWERLGVLNVKEVTGIHKAVQKRQLRLV